MLLADGSAVSGGRLWHRARFVGFPLSRGQKKRQATVAIQAEPNLHLPGFLHPNVKQLLAQRKDIITNTGLHLKAKSLDLVIASLSLFRSQRAISIAEQ